MQLLSQLFGMEGISFLLRWLHFFFGVMWIGHLYYFNFTQGTFMAQADGPTKSSVTTKLLPIALHWFRWGAMWTFATGLAIIGIKAHSGGMEVFSSSWGILISMGAILGINMWANVWFVIWPKQQIVMASAEKVAAGQPADPRAAVVAPQALLASRTNTMFSIPMLFFMGAASHFPLSVTPESKTGLAIIGFALVWLALAFNGIKGKLGYLTTVKGVIGCGFALTAYFILLLAVCF